VRERSRDGPAHEVLLFIEAKVELRLQSPTFDLREITCTELSGSIPTTAIATRHRTNRRQARASSRNPLTLFAPVAPIAAVLAAMLRQPLAWDDNRKNRPMPQPPLLRMLPAARRRAA